MRTFLWGCLFASAWITALTFADDSPAQAAEDIKQIEGTWTIAEVIVNGAKIAFDELKNFTMENGADGSWSLKNSGEVVRQGTITHDQTKTPKEFDLTFIDSEGKEMKLMGIYELDENIRKVCYTEEGNPRPKEFASTIDNKCALVTFARAKTE